MYLNLDNYRSSNGKDCGGDERDVFPIPQICGLEQIYIGDSIFNASFLEPKNIQLFICVFKIKIN